MENIVHPLKPDSGGGLCRGLPTAASPSKPDCSFAAASHVTKVYSSILLKKCFPLFPESISLGGDERSGERDINGKHVSQLSKYAFSV
jgi:hypothetical protein